MPKNGPDNVGPGEGVAADFIFTNGTVYTVDANNDGVAEAVIVKNGKIVFVGTTSAALAQDLADADTQMIDLEGKFLMPGFIDSHFHAGVSTLLEVGVNLLGTQTPEETRARLEEYMAKNPDEEVIFGLGFNEAGFITSEPGDSFSGGPDKSFLDEIDDEKPIFLIANSGHRRTSSPICNQAAPSRNPLHRPKTCSRGVQQSRYRATFRPRAPSSTPRPFIGSIKGSRLASASPGLSARRRSSLPTTCAWRTGWAPLRSASAPFAPPRS